MASSVAAESESQWAERVSRRLLAPLGARWRHTVGVAERARAVGEALEPAEAELLLAAAYVHDVGYAPELAKTGFHPIDGACFVRDSGHERLAGLIAYHSGAQAEAMERGLESELLEFADERSMVSRALTFCDLTTGSEGQPVEPAARLGEIRERYGSIAPEAKALERSEPALMDDVRTVEAMLADSAERTRARTTDGR